MKNVLYIWSNKEKQEFIEKYFDYASEHLLEFFEAEGANNFTVACRAMDYCLMCCTAAVENLKYVVPNDYLKSPKIKDFLLTPEFKTIVWSWEARNTIAHRYINIRNHEAELMLNDDLLEINGDSLYVTGFFLESVFYRDRKNKLYKEITSQDNLSAYKVLKITIDFWRCTYRYILDLGSVQADLQYEVLWNNYKAKMNEDISVN